MARIIRLAGGAASFLWARDVTELSSGRSAMRGKDRRTERGQIIFVRRTDAQGRLHLPGRVWGLAPAWPHRLVLAEVDLEARQMCCYRCADRLPRSNRSSEASQIASPSVRVPPGEPQIP